MNKKTITTSLLILAFLAVCGYVFFSQINSKRIQKVPVSTGPQAFEFVGETKTVGRDYVVMFGTFVSQGDRSIETKQPEEVAVKVTPQTKYKRTALQLPDPEDLKDTKGIFTVEDMKPVESEVDFATFSEDVSTNRIRYFAKAGSDILGKREFTATEFTYKLIQ